MGKDSKEPAIRFKGFSGEWFNIHLGDICEFMRGNLLGWKDIDSAGQHSCILYGHLYTTYGMSINQVYYYTNKNSITIPKSRRGDVLIPGSDTTPVGIARATYIGLNDVLLGGDINILRPDGSVDGRYLSYCINANRNKLIKLIKGTSVKHLVNSDLSGIRLQIPNILDEQTAIGNYFQKLDNLINQHQQKHDKLSSIKKAMLQKMFPKQGETIPEIRFKGFSGEWEEKCLFGEASITTGFPFDSADFSISGDFLVITNGNIQNNSAFVDGKIGNRIATDKIACLSQYILNVGDILITMDGSVGRSAKVIETHQILAQRVGRLVAEKDTEFLYQSLNTGVFLGGMTIISHGGTIKHISLSEIRNYALLFPKILNEQVSIGNFFQKLDHLISQQQQQITKLNNIKQACLRKMFV